jgi:hypothetical protein
VLAIKVARIGKQGGYPVLLILLPETLFVYLVLSSACQWQGIDDFPRHGRPIKFIPQANPR